MWKHDRWISDKDKNAYAVASPETKNLLKVDGSTPLNKSKS